MDTYHWAKILQIMGILIGTGFGTILLNPQVVGRLAHRINEKFLSLGHTITERYSTVIQHLMPEGTFPPAIAQVIGASSVILSAWVILSISLERNIMWMFWLSVSTIGFYAFLALIDAVWRFFIARPRRYPLWSFPILLAVRIVSGLVFIPIILLIGLIVNYLLILIILAFNAVAGRDIIRRGLIITGFLLVIFGLIFDFISA